MDSFENYRRAKEIYGGRVGKSSNLKGWFVVILLAFFTLTAWIFAYQGYTLDRAIEETAFQPRGFDPFADARADIPLEPGVLLTERKPHELAVVFLDVGQGDAIFIQTPMNQNILIDAGEGGSPDFERARRVFAGERMILPFLARNKIDRLDYFIATHPHSDHIGGAQTILSEIPVEELWISGYEHPTSSNLEMLQAAQRQNTMIRAPQEIGGDLYPGIELELDGNVKGWLLYTNPEASNVNNSSLVLLFYYGDNSILLTGDLEFPGEEAMIKQWGEQLDIDILKVGHHGSANTSTGSNFANFVKPRHSVFTVGEYNTYGHPSPEVVDRLRRLGSEIHRTDRDGTIFGFLDGQNVRITNRKDLGVVVD